MGRIGRFIDDAVRKDPEVMREVMEREWSSLNVFVDDKRLDRPCGCLVGTIAIVLGMNPSDGFWSIFKGDELVGRHFGMPDYEVEEIAMCAPKLVGHLAGTFFESYLGEHDFADASDANHARVTTIIKNRIRRALNKEQVKRAGA